MTVLCCWLDRDRLPAPRDPCGESTTRDDFGQLKGPSKGYVSSCVSRGALFVALWWYVLWKWFRAAFCASDGVIWCLALQHHPPLPTPSFTWARRYLPRRPASPLLCCSLLTFFVNVTLIPIFMNSRSYRRAIKRQFMPFPDTHIPHAGIPRL